MSITDVLTDDEEALVDLVRQCAGDYLCRPGDAAAINADITGLLAIVDRLVALATPSPGTAVPCEACAPIVESFEAAKATSLAAYHLAHPAAGPAPEPVKPPATLIVQVGVGHGQWQAVRDPRLHDDGTLSFDVDGIRSWVTVGNWRSNGPIPPAVDDETIHATPVAVTAEPVKPLATSDREAEQAAWADFAHKTCGHCGLSVRSCDDIEGGPRPLGCPGPVLRRDFAARVPCSLCGGDPVGCMLCSKCMGTGRTPAAGTVPTHQCVAIRGEPGEREPDACDYEQEGNVRCAPGRCAMAPAPAAEPGKPATCARCGDSKTVPVGNDGDSMFCPDCVLGRATPEKGGR